MKTKTCQRIWGFAFAILLIAVNYASAFYDPHIGRWINRDPIGEDGGKNVYAFVGNVPISMFDYLGKWHASVHRDKTTIWAGHFFKSQYGGIIGDADVGVDAFVIPIVLAGTSSVGQQQDRHMYYLKAGKDSRDWWYDEEINTGTKLLTRADKESNESLCREAAKSFGRGLHSRQDRSAHRVWPDGGNWSPGRMHPGWWDAWDESEYSSSAWSDVFWKNDVNKPPLYYPWAKYASEAGIQAQQRQLQLQAQLTVIADTFDALDQFYLAVSRTCVCRKAMLLR